MLISNTCSFPKMLSNLASLLIYSLCSENFIKLTENISMTKFTAKEVTVFRLATFF